MGGGGRLISFTHKNKKVIIDVALKPLKGLQQKQGDIRNIYGPALQL